MIIGDRGSIGSTLGVGGVGAKVHYPISLLTITIRFVSYQIV